MQILKTLESNISEATVLALGSFDALHIAHTQIIESAVRLAKANSMIPVVYTFHRRPEQVFNPNNLANNILSNDVKCELLQSMGVGITYFANFEDVCRDRKSVV